MELVAINSIYPDTALQWCLFHVGRAWYKKIWDLIKCESFHNTKLLQKEITRDLRHIVDQQNKTGFGSALEAISSTNAGCPGFLTYFTRNYINNGWFKHRVKAFQPSYYTNMETNSYAESWHNQLKTTNLKRNGNRILDNRPVYVLSQDILPDYLRYTRRITFNKGKMGPTERECFLRKQFPKNYSMNTFIIVI